MLKENKVISNEELVIKLEQARKIIDECLLNLVPKKIDEIKSAIRVHLPPASPMADFSVPLRPFIKKHVSGMSGPKKFTLLLAYFAKGDLAKEISSTIIKKEWDKMKPLMGGKFNWFYTGAAKENDWVETKKTGNYNLRPSWKEIF